MGYNRFTRGKPLFGNSEDGAISLGGAGSLNLKKIAIASTPTGSEQDSGWDLPANAIVQKVWLRTTTLEATGATKTMDVGTLSSESAGDANGLLDGVSVSAAGEVEGIATVTAGTAETFYASTTRGALMVDFLAGTNAAGDVGTNHLKDHLTDATTAKSITYTSGATDFAEFRGDIYIMYIVLE